MQCIAGTKQGLTEIRIKLEVQFELVRSWFSQFELVRSGSVMTYLTREDIRDHLEENADGEGNLWCTQTVRLS